MEYNPYELVYMSRSADPSAVTALFALYQTYFIYLRDTVTKRSAVYGDAEEEILLEMRIGLLEACARYREDQDASWRTFLTIVLKRRAVNVLRKADVRDWAEHTMPFDSLVKEEESVYDCFSQTDSFAEPEYCMHYAEARSKLEHVIHQMDKEEQTYVYLWTKNTSCKEGSAIMNCTEKKWYKRMEKVQNKVHEELFSKE
jgi:DNA-directed RNA polymerase specialized sigma24 family protein